MSKTNRHKEEKNHKKRGKNALRAAHWHFLLSMSHTDFAPQCNNSHKRPHKNMMQQTNKKRLWLRGLVDPLEGLRSCINWPRHSLSVQPLPMRW